MQEVHLLFLMQLYLGLNANKYRLDNAVIAGADFTDANLTGISFEDALVRSLGNVVTASTLLLLLPPYQQHDGPFDGLRYGHSVAALCV